MFFSDPNFLLDKRRSSALENVAKQTWPSCLVPLGHTGLMHVMCLVIEFSLYKFCGLQAGELSENSLISEIFVSTREN
jgi:hypothetical protein